MIRHTLLASTALLISAGSPVAAATCSFGVTEILCTAPNSDPVSSSDDGVTVTVTPGASVVSDNEDYTPVELTGNNTAINNDGLIQQTDTSKGGYAITGEGSELTITNNGQIESGDRGIEMLSGEKLTVINNAGATIESRRQTIRSSEEVPGAYVENYGTISSTEGRALQLRSPGATVINHGTLMGGEEVVEARGGFTLENYGSILIDETVDDEDGIQFAGGTVYNEGEIRATDDGIDLDEGTVVNAAGGQIISLATVDDGHAGIDIDSEYDDELTIRPNGAVNVENAGLIEGIIAIGADGAAENAVTISNSGTLRSTDTGGRYDAIRLSPLQGASMLEVLMGSVIEGNVIFGAGDDSVEVAADFAGALSDGVIDGLGGINTAAFGGFGLEDLTTFTMLGDLVSLSFFDDGRSVSGSFRNFGFWDLSGQSYTTEEMLAAAAPVPLPAALPMLLAAFGGLAALRRRR